MYANCSSLILIVAYIDACTRFSLIPINFIIDNASFGNPTVVLCVFDCKDFGISVKMYRNITNSFKIFK